MSIFVGHWIEVYGVKIVALFGSIVFSGSLVAAGFCRSVPSLITTQGILNGIGAGILYIPSVTGRSFLIHPTTTSMVRLKSTFDLTLDSHDPLVCKKTFASFGFLWCWRWNWRHILFIHHADYHSQVVISMGTMGNSLHISCSELRCCHSYTK